MAPAMLAEKLGLAALEGEEDDKLANELFEVLQAVETDMTLFFRLLANVPVDEAARDRMLRWSSRCAARSTTRRRRSRPSTSPRLAAWLRRYVARVREDGVSDAQRASA